MTTFRVWAPRPSEVELEVRGRRVAMQPEAGGWHRAEVAAPAGTEYRFVLDGDALPDPRSPWQPHGVHGPSRLFDHQAFAWTDGTWRGGHLPSAVVYELHVGTFSREGTFDGVVDRLDHLVELGVTAVEPMPVVEFPGRRGWGYDGVDLYAPHSAYGGPEGLKRLVDACHARGLAVIADVVYNHLGPSGNYLGRYGPYFASRHRTPWGEAVNLDGPDSDEVRAFFVDNALMWLRDYHFDGLRLDAVHAIVDTSAVHLVEEIVARVEELAASVGRSLFVVAENDGNDPRLVWRREVGGYGAHAQWSDDFHHALHVALTGEHDGYYGDFDGSLAQLAKALRGAYVYDGCYSPVRRRRHGRPASGLSGHRFLGYLQNHDQIGNRARGERSSALVGLGRLKVAAALVLTAPFVPMLFAGEEWAASTPFLFFTDHEPALGRAVREGRRREFAEFGWAPEDVPDPQASAAFERSKLRWEELARPPHADLLNWHRALIKLRRSLPDLSDGRMDRMRTRFDEGARWLVMERGRVRVALNLGSATARVAVGGGARGTEGARLALLLGSDPAVRLDGADAVLPPDSVAVMAGK